MKNKTHVKSGDWGGQLSRIPTVAFWTFASLLGLATLILFALLPIRFSPDQEVESFLKRSFRPLLLSCFYLWFGTFVSMLICETIALLAFVAYLIFDTH